MLFLLLGWLGWFGWFGRFGWFCWYGRLGWFGCDPYVYNGIIPYCLLRFIMPRAFWYFICLSVLTDFAIILPISGIPALSGFYHFLRRRQVRQFTDGWGYTDQYIRIRGGGRHLSLKDLDTPRTAEKISKTRTIINYQKGCFFAQFISLCFSLFWTTLPRPRLRPHGRDEYIGRPGIWVRNCGRERWGNTTCARCSQARLSTFGSYIIIWILSRPGDVKLKLNPYFIDKTCGGGKDESHFTYQRWRELGRCRSSRGRRISALSPGTDVIVWNSSLLPWEALPNTRRSRLSYWKGAACRIRGAR